MLLFLGVYRALLCYRTEGNDIEVQQLSTDHTVSNKSEASRLQSLGIDVSRLTSYGVLGSHDNTRTVGDYYLKGGYKENDILSVSLSEPIIARPEIQGGYRIDSKSWRFLVLMSSGLYKTLETYSGTTDPNTLIVRMIRDELEKGTEINIVCKVVVDEICRGHRAFCANNHHNNGCFHEDMTLLVRLFGHCDVKRESQPLSQSYTSVSSIADGETYHNRQSYQPLQHDWSMNSITQPSIDKASATITDFEVNSFEQLFQKSGQSVTSHPARELRESTNQRLQHSVSTPKYTLTTASSSFEGPRNLNKLNSFDTLQVSNAQGYVAEQVTINTSEQVFLSDERNSNIDRNGEFGQLVGSELPFAVKGESGQLLNSDDSSGAILQNGLIKSMEAKAFSDHLSDASMIALSKYRINRYSVANTQEKNFDNTDESTGNHEHYISSDNTSNIAQGDQANKDNDLPENAKSGIASLNTSFANSYVNFGPLEETLRKYGVEIDELVDGS